MKKILFIINPFSGIGKQKIVEELVNTKLNKDLFTSTIIYTEYAGHAIEIAKDAIGNYDIVVAVGGDGSINEVSQSLINSDIILGIIPAGSGNGFARHLKIPLVPEKAIELINKLNITTIDTVEINNRKFVNIAGIGFDAEMGHKFSTLTERGLLGYSKAVLSSVKDLKTEVREIVADNIKIKKDVFLIAIANATQYGFNAQISPSSVVDDGVLELIIIEKFPIIAAPAVALKLFTGKIENSKFAKTYKVSKVKIANSGKTFAHIDGEPIELKGDINVKILPKSLKIILG